MKVFNASGVRSESSEQITVFQFVNFKANQDERYRNIFAVPNGGKRNAREAHNLKLQGVKAGVPDIAVMVPRDNYHGMFIEMKVGRNKPSQFQIDMMKNLTNQNYKCIVCYSSQEAIKELGDYLGEKQ